MEEFSVSAARFLFRGIFRQRSPGPFSPSSKAFLAKPWPQHCGIPAPLPQNKPLHPIRVANAVTKTSIEQRENA
jgi:hypothetical protein